MSLKPGSTVNEYRIVKKLSEGGMGEIYLAVHQTLGQHVVLKGLHENLVKQKELHGRLAREAEAMARLSHPNIVGIYNFVDQPDGAFIVMEYVDGVTFEDLLLKQGQLAPAVAIELILQVLRGVEYAHHQGVIHRDVKPTNLMVDGEGKVRILDFGTVKLVDKPGMTRAGTTLGTASYMPIEQLMGKELTPAADIYAIGATLYEITTGRLPFEADDAMALVRKIYKEPPVPPSVYCPGMPKKLEKAILRCLAKAKEERYQTARELADALEEILKEIAPAGAAAGDLRVSSGEKRAAAIVSRTSGVGAAFAPPPPGRLGAALGAIGGAGAGFVGVVGGGALLHLGYAGPGLAVAGAAALVWAACTGVLAAMLVRFLQAPVPVGAVPGGLGPPSGPGGGGPRAAATAARITAWRYAPLDPAAVQAAGKLETPRPLEPEPVRSAPAKTPKS